MILPSQTPKNLMNPNTHGSEVNPDDLDIILEEIGIVANKLTKIKACGDETMAKIATNNLWTLHWALNMLLKYLNQNNILLLRTHLVGINTFANNAIRSDKENELDYMLTLLDMVEDSKND